MTTQKVQVFEGQGNDPEIFLMPIAIIVVFTTAVIKSVYVQQPEKTHSVFITEQDYEHLLIDHKHRMESEAAGGYEIYKIDFHCLHRGKLRRAEDCWLREIVDGKTIVIVDKVR